MNYASNSQNIHQKIEQMKKNLDCEVVEKLLSDFTEFGKKTDEVTGVIKKLLGEVKEHRNPSVIKKGFGKLTEIFTGAVGNIFAELFMV